MRDLVLKAVKQDGTTHGGFVWPYEVGAIVTALDWKPAWGCGNGLHGWLHGEGDLSACDYYKDAKWLVCEPIGTIIDLGGKVKFESATIVFVGSKDACDEYLRKECGENLAIVYSNQRGGDDANQKAGYNANQTAGYNANQKAGGYATQKAGDYANQKANHQANQTAGNNANQKAHNNATQTAGGYATQKALDYAKQKAGKCSNLSAYNNSKFNAGEGSAFTGRWYLDGSLKVAITIIGDGGLKPNTWYLFKDGTFAECEDPTLNPN